MHVERVKEGGRGRKESVKKLHVGCVNILYFSVAHNTPAMFAPQILHKLLLWKYAVLPREFENNSLCKIWGTNKVYHGQLEK